VIKGMGVTGCASLVLPVADPGRGEKGAIPPPPAKKGKREKRKEKKGKEEGKRK